MGEHEMGCVSFVICIFAASQLTTHEIPFLSNGFYWPSTALWVIYQIIG